MDRFSGTIKDQDKQIDVRQRLYRMDGLQRQFGERYSMAKMNLGKYQVYDAAQAGVVEACRKIDGRMEEFLKERRNILLYGTAGTGKDHLLRALMYRAAWYEPVRWFATELLVNREHDLDVRNSTTGAPIVFGTSDPIIPTGSIAPWVYERLYQVVDYQYSRERCVWMAINARSLEDAREILTAPIFDRVADNAVVLECIWPSYRSRGLFQKGKASGKASA